jgi:hypothetical protein
MEASRLTFLGPGCWCFITSIRVPWHNLSSLVSSLHQSKSLSALSTNYNGKVWIIGFPHFFSFSLFWRGRVANGPEKPFLECALGAI